MEDNRTARHMLLVYVPPFKSGSSLSHNKERQPIKGEKMHERDLLLFYVYFFVRTGPPLTKSFLLDYCNTLSPTYQWMGCTCTLGWQTERVARSTTCPTRSRKSTPCTMTTVSFNFNHSWQSASIKYEKIYERELKHA
jgi:hypothetical protein